MIITKKSLPRRMFLRGLGATVALPMLDAMAPAMAATVTSAAKPAVRLGFVYVPNGIIMDRWTPSKVGTGFEFTPTMKALEPMLCERHEKVGVYTAHVPWLKQFRQIFSNRAHKAEQRVLKKVWNEEQ